MKNLLADTNKGHFLKNLFNTTAPPLQWRTYLNSCEKCGGLIILWLIYSWHHSHCWLTALKQTSLLASYQKEAMKDTDIFFSREHLRSCWVQFFGLSLFHQTILKTRRSLTTSFDFAVWNTQHWSEIVVNDSKILSSAVILIWHPDFQKLECDHLQMNRVNRQRLYKVFPSPSSNILYTVVCLRNDWSRLILSHPDHDTITCYRWTAYLWNVPSRWFLYWFSHYLFETCWRNQIQNKYICIYSKQMMMRSNIRYIVFARFSLSVFQKEIGRLSQ